MKKHKFKNHIFISLFAIIMFINNSFPCFAVDGFILDPTEVDTFTDTWNSQYHLYWSPELGVYGIDQIYNEINDKLYEKYGWDIENLDDGFENYMSSIDWNSETSTVLSPQNQTDLTDLLEDGYVLLRQNFPTWLDTAQQNFMYLWAKIDATTGNVVDVIQNFFVPVTDSTFEALDDVLDECITDGEVYNASLDNSVFVCPAKVSITGDYRGVANEYSFNLNFNTDYVFAFYSDANNYVHIVYPKYQNNVAVGVNDFLTSGSYVIYLRNGLYMTASQLVIPTYVYPTNHTINGVQIIDTQLWVRTSEHGDLAVIAHNGFGDQTSVLDFLGEYTDSAVGYEYGSYTDTTTGNTISYKDRIKDILDDLVGHYVTTDDMSHLIDILDDAPAIPFPQEGENEGVIDDSLPLLFPEEGVIEALEDAVEAILERAETLDEILDDIVDETDNPSPYPPEPDPDNPNNPLPDTPPDLPNYIFPPLFTDIFDLQGLDIFKPVFDIVGVNYSMYNIWLMIPAILIFVLIIYIIISVF